MNQSDLTERQQEWLKRLALKTAHHELAPHLERIADLPLKAAEWRFHWLTDEFGQLDLVAVGDSTEWDRASTAAGIRSEPCPPCLAVTVVWNVAEPLQYLDETALLDVQNTLHVDKAIRDTDSVWVSNFTITEPLAAILLPYLGRYANAIESLGNLVDPGS